MKIEKLLLVDDDPNIRRIAQISLQKLGPWTVEMAASGREALTMLQSSSPDVVILDVMMPEMDGPTTLAAVREKLPQFKGPIIFMTAKVMANEVNEYIEKGAAGVICKPFNPKDLAGQVREICAKWQRQQAEGEG